MLIMPLADVQPEPWRNGGGVTRTLLTWPAQAAHDGWALRISLADVTASGPFSAFTGITRWFAVVEGDGVRLTWPDRSQALNVDSPPLHFDGGLPPAAELLGGPTRDLNLMLRDSACSGSLQRCSVGAAWHVTAPWRAVFTTRAATLQTGSATVALPALSMAFDDAAADQRWTLLPADAGAADAAATPAAWWLAITPH